jgi:DNA-binding beta-propeller fold protein YncE/ribosomal protein S27E
VPRTFDCPKCGAPVEFSHDPLNQSHTVKCKYCNSVLAEPTMGRPAQIIHLKVDGLPKSVKFPKWILLILLIPLLGVGAGIIAMIAGLAPLFFSGNKNTNTRSNSNSTSFPRGGPRPDPEFATVLLQFGSEGIGPGMFTDARSIAVDAKGNIYVGEYMGGRIQVFDSAGKFVTQWTAAEPKMPLRGLAADRKGTIYVVQSGRIQKFEGVTGSSLGDVKFGDGSGFDDVATTVDGGLVGAWSRNSDDIVRFDSSGSAIRTIKTAISSVTDRSELNTRVAVDGSGNIYALGTFNGAVFKFSPEGKYMNKFGGDGDKPGQFRAPQALAVDGKGKVYVSDIKGVQIFDSDGRYLGVFKPGGAGASGMIFNDQNELFVVDRTKVVKVALKE